MSTIPGTSERYRVTYLKLSDVLVEGVGVTRRNLDEIHAKRLADDIAVNGLDVPIWVTTAGYKLVAGLHRLRAHQILGKEEIVCYLIDGDDIRVEMAAIRENLFRKKLTALEENEAILRYLDLCQEMGIKVKPGEAPNPGQTVVPTELGLKTERTEGEVAEELGETRQRISRAKKIQRIEPGVRDKIKKTPIAKSHSQLEQLAKLPGEHQRAVADLVEGGKVETVEEAVEELGIGKPTIEEIASQPPIPELTEQSPYVLRVGGLIENNLADKSADAVVTCFPKEVDRDAFLGVAHEAKRILKDGGMVFVLREQGWKSITDVLGAAGFQHLWTIALGRKECNRLPGRCLVISDWVPLHVYGTGKSEGELLDSFMWEEHIGVNLGKFLNRTFERNVVIVNPFSDQEPEIAASAVSEGMRVVGFLPTREMVEEMSEHLGDLAATVRNQVTIGDGK